MNKQFSFIFHGPYRTEHLEMIEDCKKYGEIILCTDKKYTSDIEKNISFYDKICLFDSETIDEIYNYQNMFRHARSVNEGLKLADGKYCIKIRSNHCFSNLKYIINKILTNDKDKFICDNLTINPTMPYHLSDSIICGTKETMRGIYTTLINSLLNNDFIYEGIDIRTRAEVAFFCSYLKYKKITIQNNYNVFFIDIDTDNKVYYFPMNSNYIKFLDDNADLLDVKNLSPFNINFNYGKININETYSKLTDMNPNWC